VGSSAFVQPSSDSVTNSIQHSHFEKLTVHKLGEKLPTSYAKLKILYNNLVITDVNKNIL
jgi:hypothetical protein